MAYYSKGYETAAKAAGVTDTASVKKLQQELNSVGANITVDGIYGKNTDAAFSAYGSMINSANTSTTPTVTENTSVSAPAQVDYTEQLNALYAAMQNQPAFTPQAYSNPYQDTIAELTAPKTDAEYRTQAENYYQPQMNAQIESLRQANEQQNLAYAKQQSDLERSMAISRQNLDATQQKNISDLQNSMLRRGMSRSSYAAQTEANARTGWANAVSQLEQQYNENAAYIGQQQQLATSQMEQTIARLKADYEKNLAAYTDAQRNNDRAAQIAAYENVANSYNSWMSAQQQLAYQDQQNRLSNQTQMLQFMANLAQERSQYETSLAEQKRQFDAQMALKNSLGSSSSSSSNSGNNGSGGGGGGSSVATTAVYDWSEFANALNNGAEIVTDNPSNNIYSLAAEYAQNSQNTDRKRKK